MSALPLQDVRILDFSWAMAGPQGSRLLCDLGAEVIRLESATHPDLARTAFGPHPHGQGAHGFDSSGYFNHFNRNKKSVTLNMGRPEAQAVFRDLLCSADVVLENYSAGVLARWGWPFERMRAVRPDIIYVSMAGPGHRGPYAGHRTFGPTVQAVSGLTYLSGFPGMQPAGWGFSYMDHTGGYMAAMAIMIALYQRDHTGVGEHVDLSQIEAAITLTGTAILDFEVNGRESAPQGNRSRHPAVAPHGVYRCADEYERDRWLAIACYTDEQWDALVEAMGKPDWATTPELQTLPGRLAAQDQIDACIDSWTRPQRAQELMQRLQRAGVPAGVVQNHRDLTEHDQQLEHTGIFPWVSHELLGDYRIDGLPIRLSETPGGVRRRAPLWGEHTEEILCGTLGYQPDRVAELHAAEALT
jgi:crotonobetainyl-CoA:carnitine CoA-transferase CaiB-like acyl-CoA transferase